jgi:two-component system OmpR family sensor kinase
VEGEPDEEARARLLVMGEIAAEIAHELRNVLQVITANAYLARQDPAGSAAVIAKIERNARLAQSIVDDLLSLARGDASRAEPTPLVDILLAARAELADGAASWVDDLEPTDLRLRAHPGLACRLLHALYDNAVRASAPGQPVITTRACREDGAVVLFVSDDGPGVPPEIAGKLFDPLVTARPGGGGTGLGLALARRIALAHGGEIALAPSTSGATFRIRFPGERDSQEDAKTRRKMG